MANVERVLIVGGGIAGLSLATALHQQGFRADLVERSPTWDTIGAGIFLHANGVRMLEALGLGDAVAQAGAVIRQLGFYDQHGEVLYQSDLPALWGNVGPCIGIARSRLQQVLLAGAAAVPCRLGVAVTSLAQNEQQVSVGFSDGSSGVYDLVVAADGIASRVRQLTLGSVTPGYTGLMVWRSLVPRSHSSMHVLLGEGCVFGLVPVGDRLTYGFGIAGSPRLHDPPHSRLERVRSRFGTFGGPVPAYLAALTCDDQVHCGPIEWVELELWYTGRVVLIGDAAHAGPPMMAQGGCMAMEDAVVLAEVLRKAESVDAALASYVSRRRPRSDWVQQQSRAWAESYRAPATERNALLRQRGGSVDEARFGPLVAAP
jgi:2-polyprenyl-6-methoxyphenol hydroxylase-like FAD-dependent oxidoreductase